MNRYEWVPLGCTGRSRRGGWTVLVCLAAGLWPAAGAQAQNVTVQQPAVEVFGVETVVSVPDRGSLFLGGVSGAADARSTYGPPASGSALGFSRTHSSAWVNVFIHDFGAMDEFLLSQPTANRERSSVSAPAAPATRVSSPRASAAWNELQRRHAQ